MNITPISNDQIQVPMAQNAKDISPGEAHSKFADNLKLAIENVNQTQGVSNDMTKALANGEIDDLHEVMIASEKASVTMQTTVEMRNKVVEAYKEIMRMQV
ncbi:flagellar hook-basal body complex protein FliE [Halobacillus sp. A1]|uniref:flagellar hook-basal body complex protein FliE n=1 Tax=Halobacillus sp. A1 TaxID=2880262 RepID=UPI0020A6D855|nr:flagellar hook-basal body complex protein FliE [Halobacillus sp. A1]MCP3031190.1 flagellar hook-basal body complex protein FliE [Halobacillus sp. A1]